MLFIRGVYTVQNFKAKLDKIITNNNENYKNWKLQSKYLKIEPSALLYYNLHPPFTTTLQSKHQTKSVSVQ